MINFFFLVPVACTYFGTGSAFPQKKKKLLPKGESIITGDTHPFRKAIPLLKSKQKTHTSLPLSFSIPQRLHLSPAHFQGVLDVDI